MARCAADVARWLMILRASGVTHFDARRTQLWLEEHMIGQRPEPTSAEACEARASLIGSMHLAWARGDKW